MKINSISNQQYKYNRNQKTSSANANNSPAFKGFYESVAQSKPFQSVIGRLAKSDKTFTHLMLAESCLLSGFYMINTLRNKKIEKEQKPQMVINDALVLGVSSAGALFLDDKVSNVVTKVANKYYSKPATQEFYKKLGLEAQKKMAGAAPKMQLLDEVVNGADAVAKKMGGQLKGLVGKAGELKPFEISPDGLTSLQGKVKEAVNSNSGNLDKAKEAVKGCVDDVYNALAAKKEADKILPGINKIKTLIIFGIIYRYLGPVVVTPIANKISSKFFDKKKDNKAQA